MSSLTLRVAVAPGLKETILRAAADALNISLRAAMNDVAAELGRHLEAAVRRTPEWQELQPGGRLYHRIGDPSLSGTVERLLRILVESVRAEFFPVVVRGSGLKGGFRVVASRADFSDILADQGASFTTEKGYHLPWLKWLLFEGGSDELLQGDYLYAGVVAAQSRTGKGLMVKTKSGRRFSLPPEYAGVEGNNFLTRAFDTMEESAKGLLLSSLQRHLG